ncbi:ATP-binding protein [Prevotella sp.]|uniref:ATP-binding protein n=1 Tax=Prevotella sp. TaxID=59823 RepID=UPI002F91F425
MEKNITLQSSSHLYLQSFQRMAGQVLRIANKPIQLLSAYYSAVLEKPISLKQTWLLLNAQAAFVMTAFPMESPFLARIACLAWFVHALLVCRRSI